MSESVGHRRFAEMSQLTTCLECAGAVGAGASASRGVRAVEVAGVALST